MLEYADEFCKCKWHNSINYTADQQNDYAYPLIANASGNERVKEHGIGLTARTWREGLLEGQRYGDRRLMRLHNSDHEGSSTISGFSSA